MTDASAGDPEARRDPRAVRTRERLLAAAEHLATRIPFEQVTVEEIAHEAGVGVTSIYNHFGSKAGLYAAAVERALDIDRDYMDRAYTPDRTPVEQIRAAAAEYIRFGVEHPTYFRMLAFPDDTGPMPAARQTAARLAARVRDQNARLADALRRAHAEGSVHVENPDAAATYLWASCNGLVSLRWRSDDLRPGTGQWHDLRTAAAAFLDCFLTRQLPG